MNLYSFAYVFFMLQPTDDIGRISSSNDTASSCSNTEGSEEEVEEGLIDTEISIAGPSQSRLVLEESPIQDDEFS